MLSWEHPLLTSLSPAKIIESLNRTSSVIFNITGTYPLTFRPPWGKINPAISMSIRSNTLMTPVLWSLDSSDWKRPESSVLVSHVVGKVRNGDVILCHDVNPVTLEAMPGIVDGLLARRFHVTTLSFAMERTREKPKDSDGKI